ncbi:protein F37C4.5 [Aspergillus awamori]|uniref:Protein F37C4.5 n=1 Tax=Aspergillus awamori TaxID=105351 RepID=A0A401KWG5_ASPAW|nr:protein F37C4.5 [Aspergillus awamori]
MEGPAHQEFSVEDLPTKSVASHFILATITREFPVCVQPGPFTITIYNIDHKVDPDSIRVEGSSPVKVIDIQHAIVHRDPAQYPPLGFSEPTIRKGEDPSMWEERDQKSDPKQSALDQSCQVVVHLEGQMTAPASASSPDTLVPAKSELKLRDLNLNTLTSSAKIRHCALFTDMTAETWQDAQLTLPTPQTHTSCLEEQFPSLQLFDQASIPPETSLFSPSVSALGIPESTFPFPDVSHSGDLFTDFTADERMNGMEKDFYPLDAAPRRHEKAELDLQASFTQAIVPKKHVSACLRAKIQNTLPVNIGKGEMSLTVNGTCLSKSPVPSCVRNESFELNFGVDRFVKVTYKEPGITLATADEYLKQSTTYTEASCKVKNTRAHAVNDLVLDQVPVNVDDHFDFEIVTPETKVPEDKVDLTAPGVSGKKTVELSVMERSDGK